MEKASHPQLAVVIPAYQSEATIRQVLQSIPNYINDVIVVDDCSPDALTTVVEEEACRDARIHLICSSENEGVGGAMLRGYQMAFHELGAEIAVKMDSDGQMDPEYIPTLLKPILEGKADYTKGNRFLHAKELQKMPALRRLGNLGLSFLVKLASGYWNIFDPTNGFTAIHRQAYCLLDLAKIDRRFYFETSLLMELGLKRAVIKDLPIPAKYRGEKSMLSEWQSFFEFPPKIMKAFIVRILYQYFLRDFTVTSVFFVAGIILGLFGFIWGLTHWIISINTGIPATTGTVMLAVLPLILSVQLLLQCIVMDVQSVPNDPLSKDTDAQAWMRNYF